MTLGMGNEASPINFGVRLGQLWVAVFYEIAPFLVILIFELVKIENLPLGHRWKRNSSLRQKMTLNSRVYIQITASTLNCVDTKPHRHASNISMDARGRCVFRSGLWPLPASRTDHPTRHRESPSLQFSAAAWRRSSHQVLSGLFAFFWPP